MKYTAPDGYEIISNPDKPVTYQCAQTGMIEGTFESLETYSADNQYGIQQLKITRVISSDSIQITIIESSDLELQEYINSINGNESLPINLN